MYESEKLGQGNVGEAQGVGLSSTTRLLFAFHPVHIARFHPYLRLPSSMPQAPRKDTQAQRAQDKESKRARGV